MIAMTKSLSLPVQGMTCVSCVSHVEGALKELPGVSNVAITLATNKASLTYDPDRLTLAEMARAVVDVGYRVPFAELTLDVTGISSLLRADLFANCYRSGPALPAGSQPVWRLSTCGKDWRNRVGWAAQLDCEHARGHRPRQKAGAWPRAALNLKMERFLA